MCGGAIAHLCVGGRATHSCVPFGSPSTLSLVHATLAIPSIVPQYTLCQTYRIPNNLPPRTPNKQVVHCKCGTILQGCKEHSGTLQVL